MCRQRRGCLAWQNTSWVIRGYVIETLVTTNDVEKLAGSDATGSTVSEFMVLLFCCQNQEAKQEKQEELQLQSLKMGVLYA